MEKLKTESQSVYKIKDTRPGCDQIAHLLRSIFWSPNHLKHWNKERKKDLTNK
jgi:hypothetical protein